MGKRVDAVLLVGPVVFVVEFKVGAAILDRSAIEQVWDYALDLKNFHEASHHLPIVPIATATELPDSPAPRFTSIATRCIGRFSSDGRIFVKPSNCCYRIAVENRSMRSGGSRHRFDTSVWPHRSLKHESWAAVAAVSAATCLDSSSM